MQHYIEHYKAACMCNKIQSHGKVTNTQICHKISIYMHVLLSRKDHSMLNDVKKAVTKFHCTSVSARFRCVRKIAKSKY